LGAMGANVLVEFEKKILIGGILQDKLYSRINYTPG